VDVRGVLIFCKIFAAPDASSKYDKDLRFVFGIVAAVP
jgi:hypothetical protein